MEKDYGDNDGIARYTGHVKNCLRDGQGTYKFAHGGNDFFVYDGPWSKGVRQGQQGTFSVTGFSEYSGNFSNGEITGQGRRVWADGRLYEGEFLKGEMHGKGRWTSSTGSESYEGEFRDNKRHGFGILQTYSGLYKGEFANNQFHGPGVYLFSRCCLIKSMFRNNLTNGPTFIKWLKHGTLECSMVDGYAEGKGYFFAEDESFDFEGSWEEGFPSYSLIAKYSWCDIEKAVAAPQLDAKGKPVPSKAKGPEGGIPQIIAGSSIGKIIVKTSCTSISEAIPPVPVQTKGKPPSKGDDLAKPTLPEPDMFSVPCERLRKMYLTIRKLKQITAEAVDDNLEEPVNFWLRNKSLSEFGSDRFRFPPSATLFIDGECAGYGSSVSSAPILAAENCHISEVSPAASVLVASASLPDEMAALKVGKGICLNYSLPLHELNQAYEAVTYVVDFKIDVYTLASTFRSALMQSRIIGQNATMGRSQGRTASSQSAGGKRGNSHRVSSGASASANYKQFMDFTVLSLSRSYNGVELLGSKLVLALVIPDNNLKKMAKKIAKLSKEAVVDDGPTPSGGLATSASGPSLDNSNTNSKVSLAEATANAIGGDLVDIDWTDCVWELRSVSTAAAQGGLSPSHSVGGLGHGVIAEDLGEDQDHASVSTDADNYNNSSCGSVGSRNVSHPQQSVNRTHTTVVARWRENAFSCGQWHSLALNFRSGLEQGMLEQLDDEMGGITPVVSLMIDGSGRIRVPMEPSNAGGNHVRPFSVPSSAPSNLPATVEGGTCISSVSPVVSTNGSSSVPGSPARITAVVPSDITDGILLAWLPENPVHATEAAEPNQEIRLDDKLDSVPDATQPHVSSATALEIKDSTEARDARSNDFTVVVRVGGDNFVGFVKCIAACSA
jgi:hypothetical protein